MATEEIVDSVSGLSTTHEGPSRNFILQIQFSKEATMKDSAIEKATHASIQPAYGIRTLNRILTKPIAALAEKVKQDGVDNLNQLLVDTITLRDLYRKHHWQASGPTFFMLHQLYDKHYHELDLLVDVIAERIMQLGGVSLAMSNDVAEMTRIPRPPKDREQTTEQFRRLLNAHEILLEEAHSMASYAERDGDVGTGDLIVSDIIRTNQMQVWFVSVHHSTDSAEIE